jgi:Flp pilus assembly pilin Flp
MKEFLRSLWQDESGQDLAEYAMLVVLIAIVALTAVSLFGNRIATEFNNAEDQLFTP